MDFSLEQFTPLIGEAFVVQTAHGPIELTLVEARAGARRGLPEQLRTPLSLIFDGPDSIVLSHDTYRVHHAAIGEQLLNIVPVMGPPGAALHLPQYQVLFN